MQYDLTAGPVARTMLKFSLPMIFGDLFQQLYNISDTLIVGWFIGTDALAAVGTSYTLIIFLTSILLGLCMGSGALFSIFYGEKNTDSLKSSIFLSFMLILIITAVINVLIFIYIDEIIVFMQIPLEIYDLAYEYLYIIFIGFSFTFIYNYFTCLLRAVGNSNTPLLFFRRFRRFKYYSGHHLRCCMRLGRSRFGHRHGCITGTLRTRPHFVHRAEMP